MATNTTLGRGFLLVLLTLLALPCSAQTGSAAVSVDDYGIKSGNQADATANTVALRKLVAPAAYGGNSADAADIVFPDGKTYYFDDVIPFRDGVHVDLHGSTLHFNKVPSKEDNGSGFVFALRDFSIANGTIEVDYDGTGFPHAGNALMLGQRVSNGGKYFPDSLDSQMSKPMGNIVVRNMKIVSNNPANGSCGVLMFGGLENVVIDGLSIDGQQRLICGIYYEFGMATKVMNAFATPKPPPFYTSHAHAMKFLNIAVNNLNPGVNGTIAMGLGGAYDTLVDGLTVTGNVGIAFMGTAGEAAFYRMWPKQIPAANRIITLRHITADATKVSGLSLGGSGTFASKKCMSAKNPNGYCGYLGKYLDPSSYTAAEQTDELNYVVDGFDLRSASGNSGWGIYSSAGSIDVRNGTLTGFSSGIAVTDDCTIVKIDHVKVVDSSAAGIRLDFGVSIWNPARPKTGFVRNSTVVGSGTRSTGAYAVTLNSADGFVIADNTFGRDSERTQGGAVRLGRQSRHVKGQGNRVMGVANNAPAFVSQADSAADENEVEGNSGIATTRGNWRRADRDAR